MVKAIVSFVAILLLFTPFISSANQQVDSLLQELSTTKSDTHKIALNIEISRALLRDEKAFEYAEAAGELSNKLNDKKWQAKAMFNYAQHYQLFNDYDKAQSFAFKALEFWQQIEIPVEIANTQHLIGDIFRKKGEFDISIEYFNEALEKYTELGNKVGIANCKNSIGVVQKNKGNLATALKYYLEALEIRELLKDEKGIAAIYSNIAVVYRLQGDYKQSLKYNFQALEIRKEISYLKGVADSYNNIGIVYKNQKDYEQALAYYKESLAIRRQTGNVRGEAYSLNNIAVIYSKLNNIEKALEYNLKSLDIKEKIGDKYSLISSYLNIGQVYFLAKNYELSEKYAKQSLELSKALGARDSELSCYRDLAALYSALGKYDLAYQNQKNYTNLNDSLRSMEKTRVISELQADYEYRKLRMQDSLKYLAEKQARDEQYKREVELNKERSRLERQLDADGFVLIRNALIIGFVLVLLLAASLYSRYRFVKKSRRELEATNKELSETLLSKDEKEVLLREIHHRVKNNLQIITSLIRLQAENVKDEEVLEMFSESQNRIKSMALVHEELYQTKDLANVNVNNYLSRLIKDLIFTYTIDKNIDANIAIEVETLGIDTLVPLGLIVNEIISNSLKHAFWGREKGQIFIHLKLLSDQQTYLLHIGDNGKGFKQEVNAENSNTLGLELVYTLVDQLEGKVDLSTENGVVYDISFKKA